MSRRLMIPLLAAMIGLSACTPAQFALFSDVTSPTATVLDDAQLSRLRTCESTNNYAATSRSGTYRGAYQFDQTTWNDVAGRHYPWLISRDPVAVEWYWQDAMARALWSERGAQPWPHCGRRV